MLRIVLLISALLGVALSAFGQQAINQQESAPAFELKDLKGRTVRLNDYRGKVLLLNFWATWCAPCRAEMPDLLKMQNEYQSKGLQVVGMTYPDYTRSGVRSITRRLKVNYPILLGNPELAEKYGVGEVLPTTIVIDRDGRI